MAAETEQKMQTCDLLIRNAYVLTCDEQRSVFTNGAIAIQGTDIEAVGIESELTALYHPNRVMDAGGGLVHPGLMDLHYHVNYHLVGKLVAEVDLSDTDPGPWAARQYNAMINTLGDEEERTGMVRVSDS